MAHFVHHDWNVILVKMEFDVIYEYDIAPWRASDKNIFHECRLIYFAHF